MNKEKNDIVEKQQMNIHMKETIDSSNSLKCKYNRQISLQKRSAAGQDSSQIQLPHLILSPSSQKNKSNQVKQNQALLTPKTSTSLKPNFNQGDCYDSCSDVSITTAGTRALSLQCRLKDQHFQIRQLADYEEGESVCFYQRGGLTDEILEEELFMPYNFFICPHQSKMSWEKENRDYFHKITNLDTGQKLDVRQPEELEQIMNQIPQIHLNQSTYWKIWWDRKRKNEQEFEMACKLNLTDTIKSIIQGKEYDLLPNLNKKIENGKTPLHYAAFYGNTTICNMLILKEVDIDPRNDLQQTPLIISCLENMQDVAALLIELGAYINAQDIFLNSPLHYCFLNGNKDLLDIILRKPYVQLNLKNSNDKLAFQETKNEKLVEYFKNQVLKKKIQREALRKKLRLRQINQNDKENDLNIRPYKDEESDSQEGDYFNQINMERFFSNESFFSNPLSIYEAQTVEGEISNYEIKGLLGKGAFGQVYLVLEKSTGKEYALKMLNKAKIIEKNMYKYSITERNILQAVCHPFIVKLEKAFQTNQSLFFLMENGKLGDVLQHLKCEKRFSEIKARFYAAEVLVALEYLHYLDILYRDLKASNILIGEDGHILLSDFGLSKEGVKDYDSGARSFCGSVAYMPPEILRNQSHGKAVDLYLLGVFIYEMLVGSPPFSGKDENAIYNNIQMSQLKFPSFLSRTSKSLLIKLLSKDPRFRPTSDQIKRHPFFSGINWKQLELKNIKPPKTNTKQTVSPLDSSNLLESERLEIFPDEFKKKREGIEVKNTLFNQWSFIAPQINIQ